LFRARSFSVAQKIEIAQKNKKKLNIQNLNLVSSKICLWKREEKNQHKKVSGNKTLTMGRSMEAVGLSAKLKGKMISDSRNRFFQFKGFIRLFVLKLLK